MDEYSALLPNASQKALTSRQELPKENTGEIKGGLPMIAGTAYGKQGISKDVTRLNTYDLKITARMRYTLRKRHAYVSAVHKAIVRQACKAELCVEAIDSTKKYDETAKAAMEQFIKDGFGANGEKKFRAYLIDTKKWNGDAWAEIVFDTKTKAPVYTQKLIAETMRILPDEHGLITGYPQIVDGTLNFVFPPQNIMHIKENEDEYSFFGYSDLDALYSALLLDVLADENMQAKLDNDSSPGGIMEMEEADETELLRLQWLIVQQMRQAPGKPLLLNGIKQWIPPQLATRDMDWQELHHHVKEKVMMVYGVLPMQVAVVETGKLANPDQQIEIGEEYIRQELESVQEIYNIKLTPFFENSENLMFKFGDVQPKYDTLQKEANVLKTKADAAKVLSTIPGAYLIDEIREITGHEPLDANAGQMPVQQPVAPAFGAPAQDAPQDVVKSKVANGQLRNAPDVSAKPFGGYENFADCVNANQDKDDPNAYCASIMHAVEGSATDFETRSLAIHKATRAQNEARFADELLRSFSKFTRDAIKEAKRHYAIPTPEKRAEISSKSIQDFISALGNELVTLAVTLEANSKTGTTRSYRDAKTALGLSFGKPDEHAIASLLLTGGTLNAIKDFTHAQREGFATVLRTSFDEGLDLRNMVKEMRNYAETETYKLERIARTESNRFANQGRFAGYKELEQKRGEEFEYDWVGPQDERTTEICTDIKAGNPYSLEEIQQATDGGEPHINCRHNAVRSFK